MSGYRPPIAPVVPPGRSAVFTVGTLVGVGAGLALAALWLPSEPASIPAPVVVATDVADVYELTLVMPTIPPPPTYPPTMTPPPVALVDICGQPTPGAMCRVPQPPPPLPTPYPSCLASPESGSLCVWPRVTPVGGFAP